jgi:hypothetical protein
MILLSLFLSVFKKQKKVSEAIGRTAMFLQRSGYDQIISEPDYRFFPGDNLVRILFNDFQPTERLKKR